MDQTKQSHVGELPNITFRQLEVFRSVCLEGSYANAALELRSSRPHIKRLCREFEKSVGRPLFEDAPGGSLRVTPFAQGLLGQVPPLSRSLRRLEDSVRALHEKGRILRFAAAGEFFKGGLFTDFLSRLKISDSFRPCFLRIETGRFRTALLNVECDVYIGAGIRASDRLDLVNLGPIPWIFRSGPHYQGKAPDIPADLVAGKWWLTSAGEAEATANLLADLHAAGARRGRILHQDSPQPGEDEIVLTQETAARQPRSSCSGWPCFQLSAVLRKNHPYSELMPRLLGAANAS